MIDISVDVEGRDSFIAALSGLRDQLPYATAIAINRTAEEVLAEARREIQSNFIVRVPKFDLPPTQLPAAWRATKDRQIATFNIGDADGGRQGIGSRRVETFTKFEYGKPKVADDPDFPIAIPTKAIRPSPTILVPRSLYPTSLRLAPIKDASGATLLGRRKGKVRDLAGNAMRGRKKRGLEGIGGTFTINDESGRPIGVFQRTGRGAKDIRLVWAYRQQIRIPRLMDLAVQGSRIITERFGPNFDGAIELAIRTSLR